MAKLVVIPPNFTTDFHWSTTGNSGHFLWGDQSVWMRRLVCSFDVCKPLRQVFLRQGPFQFSKSVCFLFDKSFFMLLFSTTYFVVCWCVFFIFILINLSEYVFYQCQKISRSDKMLGLILVQIADKGYQQMALASTVTPTQLMFIMQYVFLTALQFTEMYTLIVHIDFRRIFRQKQRHVSV